MRDEENAFRIGDELRIGFQIHISHFTLQLHKEAYKMNTYSTTTTVEQKPKQNKK